MKRILFIIDKFYPQKTAITNCLESIFEELKNQKIIVDVLTYKQDKNLKNNELINDINIFRVNDYYNMSNNVFFKKTVLRIYRKLFFKRKMIKEGKKLLKRNKYDDVIACSYPFLMEEIAYEITKNTKCFFISYQFDPYANNRILNEKDKNKRLKKEIKILCNASKVFLPKENYEENMKTGLKILKGKYYPIDFALIKEKKEKIISLEDDKIIFAFTGTFYNSIRMPFNMLDFFKSINIPFKIIICYGGYELVDNILNEYKQFFKDNLILFKNKPKEECDKILNEANIIINIGNEIANQIPSKVFEYISLGKPIVNFFSIQNDTSKKVLKNYPLVLNIYKEYTIEDVKRFEFFCQKNRNIILPFNDATKNYKTANEIAKEFIKEVEKCNENK